MIEQITQTTGGYQVTIGGQVTSVPNDPENEDYQRVQKALADGMELTVPPGPTIEQTRQAVDAERDKRLGFPFEFQGNWYDRDPTSVARISGAGVLALGAMVGGAKPGNLRWHGGDSDFGWIALDNKIVPMDAQTVFAFGQAAARVESELVFIANWLKKQDPIPADFASGKYWP